MRFREFPMLFVLLCSLGSSLVSPNASAQCNVSVTNTQLIGGIANQGGSATVFCSGNPLYVQVGLYTTAPSGTVNMSLSSGHLEGSGGTVTYSNPIPVSKNETIQVYAYPGCCGATTYSSPITISPNPISFVVAPSSIVGTREAIGTVTFQYPVLNDAFVYMSPYCCVINLPNAVKVPAGQTTVNFPVNGSMVSSEQQFVVSAKLALNDGNFIVSQNVNILPPQTDLGPCKNHCEQMAGEPINLVNGNVWLQQTDYDLPGTGGGMDLVRTWNSLWISTQPPASAGIFGKGWWSTYEERLTFASDGTILYWRGDGSYSIFAQGASPGSYTLASPPDERASLQFSSGADGYILTLKDGTTRSFTSTGYLLTSIDRNGNQTRILYNGSNIASVTDPAGRVLTFNYASQATPNQVSSIQDAVGTIATYAYDASSNLTQAVYADGSSLNMAYDQSGQLTGVTDGNAKVIESHTYDSSRRGLTSAKANGVDAISIVYSSGETDVYNSKGNKITYQWADSGGRNLITYMDGAAGCDSCGVQGTWRFVYDSNANRTSTTDALGRVTNYTYDANANMLSKSIQLTSSQTLTWAYTYNQFGEVLTDTDPLGNLTSITYDAYGNVLSETTPSPSSGVSGSTTSFTYDSTGALLTKTDPLNNKTTSSYTTVGLLASVTDAQGNTTAFTYDPHGNRLTAKDPAGNTTSYTYDLRNRLTKTSFVNNTSASFAYDTRGRKISATDPNGDTTTYGYDDADRLINKTDAASRTTQLAYDTENNLTSITDAKNRVTTIAYDQYNRPTTKTFPSSLPGSLSSLSESYTYDSVGNLLSKTDRKSQTLQYAYDALNRCTKKTYPGGASIQYTYDGDSNLIQASDSTGTYTFTYDNTGRLTATSTQYSFVTAAFTNSYAYDVASNLTSFSSADGSANSYSYDTLNRLVGRSNSWAGSFGYSYDALGRRTQMTRPNNVTTTYSYDNLSRLSSVLHQVHGSILDGTSYSSDHDGNRTSKVNMPANVTTNYVYDAVDELTSASGGSSSSYSYDTVGNRVSSSLGLFTYNSLNELTAGTSGIYTYDSNGNTTSRTDSTGTTTYSWDYDNRLTTVVLPLSAGTITFQYDPFGHRIEKISSTATSIFVYDGSNLVKTVDGAGKEIASYVQDKGIDKPLAIHSNGAVDYFEQDGLGSITSLTTVNGTVAQSYTYDSFGNITNSTGSLVNPFGFAGRERDIETNLSYYRARYYDSVIGRFISEDPLGFASGDVNFYAYVRNNPINLIDPFGLSPAEKQPDPRCVPSKFPESCEDKLANIDKLINGTRTNEMPNAEKGLAQRFRQLQRPKYNASDSGHVDQILYRQAQLRKAIDDYLKYCGDPPNSPVPNSAVDYASRPIAFPSGYSPSVTGAIVLGGALVITAFVCPQCLAVVVAAF